MPDGKGNRTPRQARPEKVVDFLYGELLPDEANRKSADPRKRFGKYLLTTELGSGGSGTVYKAYDTVLNAYVALKILTDTSKSSTERFRKEAKIVANLDHPNIVPIHEVGENDGKAYLSMKYIDGTTLDKLSDKLEIRQLIEIISKVCDALESAHKYGVIHRDIKPQNIIVDRNGFAYLVDFGLAKIAESDLTMTRAVMGTPQFMSPEQVRGGDLDERTDIYSIGATLYSCLAGVNPFDGNSAMETITKVIESDPPALKKVAKMVSSDTSHVVMKCLHKDPEARYQSIRELKEELTRLLNREPVMARGGLKAYTLRKVLRKTRTTLAIITTIALIIMISYIYITTRGDASLTSRKKAMAFLEDGTHLLRQVKFPGDDELIGMIKENLAGAKEKFSLAIQQDPTLTDAYLLRSECNFIAGEIDHAINDLAAATEQNPQLIDPYIKRIVYRGKKAGVIIIYDNERGKKVSELLKPAYRDLEKLKSLDATEPVITLADAVITMMEGIADTEMPWGWRERTLKKLNSALEQDPSLIVALQLRGAMTAGLALNTKDTQKQKELAASALADLTKSLELGEVDVRMYELCIDLYEITGEYRKAVHYSQVLQGFYPDHPNSFIIEAKYKALLGEEEMAKILLETASNMDMSQLKPLYKASHLVARGEIFLILGSKEEAEKEFSSALSGLEGPEKKEVERWISRAKSNYD